MKLGYVVGEASPTHVIFISKKPPRLGQYVILEYDGKKVLGIVRRVVMGSVALSEDIHDPTVVERIKDLEGERDYYIKGIIKILGDVKNLEIPRVPPPPATEVREADSSILKEVFSCKEKGVCIGVLASNPEVPVYIDINRMVSRHLAILAITGAGKSNTVAVISDGILGLGGAVLIFDMHSEYVDARFRNGDVNPISPRVNPLHLHLSELLKLLNIDYKAHRQEYYFRKALKKVYNHLKRHPEDTEMFFKLLVKALDDVAEESKSRDAKNVVISVQNKLEAMQDKYGFIIDLQAPSVLNQIKLGYVNVVDLGALDEDASDVIVSHYLRTLLYSRKSYKSTGEGLAFPVFVVLEEAHILAPKGRSTLSKYWISRIAREGRKFGLGLCLVSQRPKALDPDTLSQANNMIVLRLVEPSDQRFVQQASETLSEDLLEQLPSLNIGEAVVLGLMVKIPAIVKINKFEGKLSGGDIDIVSEWKRIREEELELEKAYNDITEEW
ncbi:MAG: ATP-binding protein [Thermoproteales archaeon]|nr:ATP-binding protein [Thermoproteales archaeon]